MLRASNHYRLDIEGLRTIAVGLVVAFHYDVRAFHGGYIGVDIFFVISGYLITGLLTREVRATATIDFLRFYGRRAKRLLPAALLTTIVTLVVGSFVFSPPEMLATSKAAFASSIYLSNFWFLRATLDYFAAESSLNPFLHTWSLSVEEQFYFVWPALILFCGVHSKNNRRPLIGIGITILL
ncbi:MAG: acyltransferase, partial [Burkholderiaceae bacterium]